MLQEPHHLLLVQHIGQLPRLTHEGEVARHLRSIERDPEAQRRDRVVHSRRLAARLALLHLEPAQILRRRAGRRAAEKLRKGLDGADVVALGGGPKLAHRHVFDHALAQRAGGRLAHRGLLS
jgi:hypothetical protein